MKLWRSRDDGAAAVSGVDRFRIRLQMREFYLSKLEEPDVALRMKFHKIYQYY